MAISLEMEATRGRRRRIGNTRGDQAFAIVNYSVLAMFAIMVLYPLIYVFSSSFSSGTAIESGAVHLWPVGLNVDAYQQIFKSDGFVSGLVNSFIYAIGGALLGTVLTVLAGYPLSRMELVGRRALFFILLVPTLFSAGIIPTYIVVQNLGLLNTRLAIILPSAMSVFNVIITRTFYEVSIPNQIIEAASIDGATDFGVLLRVVLPLSKPIIAVNLLFYAVAQWNGWFSSLIYLNNQQLFPLQLILRNILIENQLDATSVGGQDAAALLSQKDLFDKLKYALIVVAIVPPMIAYPFVQKHFVKGVLLGAVK